MRLKAVPTAARSKLLTRTGLDWSTARGRLYLFVAIDRTWRFAFTELHEKATRQIAADFLLHLIKGVPYKIHS